MKKIYNILVPGEKYNDKNTGKEKQKWNNIGVAFSNENGSISCKLEPNISVAKEFVLFKQV